MQKKQAKIILFFLWVTLTITASSAHKTPPPSFKHPISLSKTGTKAHKKLPLQTISSHPYLFALGTASIGLLVISCISLWNSHKTKTEEPPCQTATAREGTFSNFDNERKKEPWKTEEDILKIAQGLEETLKKELQNYASPSQKDFSEKIKTLQEETAADQLQTGLFCHAIIPNNAQLYMHADLHGDSGPIEAMLNHLEDQKLFDPKTGIISGNAYVAFLGDYIDRGPESLKNLWLLWQLKQRNPEHVFLIRGNHETTWICSTNGFFANIITICNATGPKDLELLEIIYPIHQKIFDTFCNAFALLPIVTCIDRGCIKNNRLALLHGGINPKKKVATFGNNISYNKNKTYFTVPTDVNSYLWSDFFSEDNEQEKFIENQRGAGYILYKNNVANWMKSNDVKTIFHGHDQKNKRYKNKTGKEIWLFTQGKWRGLGSRWDDTALVLNVAPNTGYYSQKGGGYYYNYGTFICIKPKPANVISTQLPTNPQFASNTRAQELTTLPDYILEPIYFKPVSPHTIVPYDQIMLKVT